MSFIKKFWEKRNALAFSDSKKLVFSLIVCLCTGIGMTIIMALLRFQSYKLAIEQYFSVSPLSAVWTAVFLFFLASALSFLFSSLFAGNTVVSLAALLASLVNHFKMQITSTVLEFSDIAMIFQITDVAQLNSEDIVFAFYDIASMIVAFLWLAVIFILSKPLRMKLKWSLISAGASIGAFVLIFVFLASPLVYESVSMTSEYRLKPPEVEKRCGIMLSLWRDVVIPANIFDDSSDYTQEYMEYILKEAMAYAGSAKPNETEKDPNIILLLSESFFDLGALDNCTWEKDPLEVYRRLAKDSVSGKFYSPTAGYGTSNIGLSILTGINLDLLNAGENLWKWEGERFTHLPTVPQLLQERGYYTGFIHTFNDSIYERSKYLSELGFEDIYFPADFAGLDDELAQAEDYYAMLDTKISGGFYSDDFMTELIINMYEKQRKKGSDPAFIYALSMENHGPHNVARDGETFSFETGGNFDEEQLQILSVLAQGVNNASLALERLIEYFDDIDEPTVIIFFGDHLPALGFTDGTTLLSRLDAAPPQNVDWTLEQVDEFYSTEYLIWSNDDDYLPQERGSIRHDSANFLGLTLLEASGQELPNYWRIISGLREKTLFYGWRYYVSAEGEISDPIDITEPGDEAQRHFDMSALLYDTFYGEQYVTKRLNEYD